MARVGRLALLGIVALGCGDSSSGGGAGCFSDSDGLTGGTYTFDLRVDDDGFSKNILAAQNLAEVTLTLTNAGSRPHGFEVECKPVVAPKGCSTTSCFPSSSAVEPIAPGASKTVMFVTPTPEGIYSFRSGAPADAAVKALNDGQFIVM